MWTALGIALAGGLGAGARHLVDTALSSRRSTRFPWGILTVNLTGAFVIGVLTGLAADHPLMTIGTTGFLGGYTTFSTASLDTVQLLGQRRYRAALANGAGMLVAAVALAVGGILLGRSLV
ncbi:CrcB family protein [Leucobacter sp. USCH14]|uniref:fluoride efflux transporter FluC n=1 Tax=Leucobacter sp. USCH14 TaxID=3024838 RepID=UPI0030AF504B